MIYCDTSLIVAALTNEPHSERARHWLRSEPAEPLAISAWTLTEVASALAMKHRRGVLDDAALAAVDGIWTEFRSARCSMLAIDESHFREAGVLVNTPPRGLRAADALHLAVALRSGAAIATFDHDLAESARARGLDVHPRS